MAIDGRPEGDRLIHGEDVTYSDGIQQRRVWTQHPDSPADDVVGNVLCWRCVLSIPVDDKVYQVDFDDWMCLIDERTLVNRSFMAKFGFELG